MGRRPLATDPPGFWALVDQSGDCWPWTRGKTSSGYGGLRWDGQRTYAHRVAYRLAIGPIPAGLSVLHRCDNPPCVRPEHLFAGTAADNAADMVAKGRQARATQTHCLRGHLYDEANTYFRPSGGRKCRACKQLEKIRARTRAPRSPLMRAVEVAALLGVSPSTVRRWRGTGHLQAVLTKGGHARFHPEEVESARRRMGLV